MYYCLRSSSLELLTGIRYTELRISPPAFRRTDVPRSHREKWGAAWRLGRAAREMVAADVVVEPTPDWMFCRMCPFRAPCIAMSAGGDVAEQLAADYRRKPPDVLEEGRLGGRSWSTNRGAAPLRLGRQ